MCPFAWDTPGKGPWELFGAFQRKKDLVRYGHRRVMSTEPAITVIISDGLLIYPHFNETGTKAFVRSVWYSLYGSAKDSYHQSKISI